METTAYALLAQMALGRLKYAGPIVTWLASQRDPQGGFVSTQVRTMQNYPVSRDWGTCCIPDLVGVKSGRVFTNDSSASIIEFIIGFKGKTVTPSREKHTDEVFFSLY